MLIITGTGRSGTETYARMFSGYHEFRVGYILDKYFLKSEPHGEPFDTLGKRIEVIMDLHQGIDKETFVDASNLYIHFIDALDVLNPFVRFILGVRNGKDFVRSAFSRRWHERETYGMVPPRDDLYFERWKYMTPLQRNAWIWVYRNRKALDNLSKVPASRRLVVRLEDIGDPGALLRLQSFSGIALKESVSRIRYNANAELNLPPKEAWTNEMNVEFGEIAGEMMEYFGYR